MSKPSILEKEEDGEKHIQVGARSIKEARHIMKGLKKKYPQLDIDKALKKACPKREYLDNIFSFQFQIGGDKAFRSICKTAVNFYILNGGNPDNIRHLVPYLKNGQGGGRVWS